MKQLFTLSLLAIAALTGANAADFPIKDKPVTIVAVGSLPNDGKVIEDARSYQ